MCNRRGPDEVARDGHQPWILRQFANNRYAEHMSGACPGPVHFGHIQRVDRTRHLAAFEYLTVDCIPGCRSGGLQLGFRVLALCPAPPTAGHVDS
jgi:hypothetical protein